MTVESSEAPIPLTEGSLKADSTMTSGPTAASVPSDSAHLSDKNYDYLATSASSEIYSGPVSESIPSSYSTFHHRRFSSRLRHDSTASRSQIPVDAESLVPSNRSVISFESDIEGGYMRGRADSLSSFKFFSQEEVENAGGASTHPFDVDPIEYEVYRRDTQQDEEISDSAEFFPPTMPYPHQHPNRYSYEEASRPSVELLVRYQEQHEHEHPEAEEENFIYSTEEIPDDASTGAARRRRSSDHHFGTGRDLQEEPLLSSIRRGSSVGSAAERFSSTFLHKHHYAYSYKNSHRLQQRFYISEEDLVIFIAGFNTSKWRSILYTVLCTLSLGVVYLVLRWFPRWRIAFIGTPSPLGQCDWVVIENQWGELKIVEVITKSYYRPLSTVFWSDSGALSGDPEETPEDTESDQPSDQHSYHSDHSGFQPEKDPQLPALRILQFRYLNFIYNPIEDIFQTNNDWVDTLWTDVEKIREGLDTDTHDDRELVFGPNVIDIKEKPVFQLLIDEVLHPFYIFQVFSIILWSCDEYYYYAGCIFLISVISVGNTLVETKQTLKRLRNISRFVCDVRVIRNGYWTTVKSGDLVPGDIYELSDPSLSILPCDSLLISGDCIVNESMLTGESVPVSKLPVTDDVLQSFVSSAAISPELSRRYLYCGTKIIRVRRPALNSSELDVALAMAVRTGFSTTKGSLVRSMLFPKPSGFKFYQDSFKYIGFMGLVACLGFIICTFNFIRMHLATHLIVLRALDLITIVVPPALPATLTIGTNISLSRLRRKQIFCISPTRINVGGKLDVICFDKTGTLTEDGLDVLGVRIVKSGKLSELYHDSEALENASGSSNMLAALVTCHSLRCIDDELVGDPLDFRMFQFTGWSFEEFEDSSRGHHGPIPIARSAKGERLATIRSFEFMAQLRRMSVLVRPWETHSSYVDVYVKGAPEVMAEICSSGISEEFDDLLHYYTHRGYRVIACAHKRYENLSMEECYNLNRQQVESGLEFLGFIVFENKLKPSSAGVIEQLNKANIRTLMCTGDNVLTAISVARECNIIDNSVFVPHFKQIEDNSFIQWECLDDRRIVLDTETLTPLTGPDKGYSLAVTGDAFRYIVQFGSEAQLQNMLIKGSIFARMSPDEKHELVEKLQAIDYTTGFCGDGANDCGALKAADVGISLSEAEASVAAPFTSRIFEVSCVLDVIKEGRSALVTSFSCFKYMSLYSAIQFVTVGVLYSLGSNLGDFQFLWIDLFLILPIAIFMAWSEPYPSLAKKRPTANLVSRKILVPLIGEIALLTLTQFFIWYLVRQQPWYVAPIQGGEDNEVTSSDNSALFFASCLQYIFVAVILSVGPPYRQPIYQNYPFVITICITVTATLGIMIFVDPSSNLGRQMQLSYLSRFFQLLLITIILINFAVSWIFEKYVFQLVAQWLRAVNRLFGIGKIHSRKRYKMLGSRQAV